MDTQRNPTDFVGSTEKVKKACNTKSVETQKTKIFLSVKVSQLFYGGESQRLRKCPMFSHFLLLMITVLMLQSTKQILNVTIY